MEKELVPYKQSMVVKEFGFDEPCFGVYLNNDKITLFSDCKWEERTNGKFIHDFMEDTSCVAPTFSQAFRFFREKYGLRGFIGFRPNVNQFDYHIYDMSLSGKEYAEQRTMEEFNKDPKVGTYEEAELGCIDKLIEIVKEHGTNMD